MGNQSPGNVQKSSKFVFCSSNEAHFHWVSAALHTWQVVQQELAPIERLAEQIGRVRPQLVLLDFSGNCRGTGEECAQDMLALAQTLKIRHPGMHLVAVGSSSHPEGAVAAINAGVHHFINMQADGAEARDVIGTMIAGLPATGADPCSVIALLGARAGIGTTTLAVHLADILQRQDTRQSSGQRVALLDLGWPAADGPLYLNISNGDFDLLDAIRNRHRMDATLIQTALAHNQHGLRVLSLPHANEKTHAISGTDAIGLLMHLRAYFDVLIIDLGGFPDEELIARIANAADQAWLLTDQSVGSLVSLDALVKMLDNCQLARSKRHLIVNRYDDRSGMSASQISERFKTTLKAAIPESRDALVAATNAGKLLHENSRSHAYTKAVTALAGQIINTEEGSRQSGSLFDWLQRRLMRQAKRHA